MSLLDSEKCIDRKGVKEHSPVAGDDIWNAQILFFFFLKPNAQILEDSMKEQSWGALAWTRDALDEDHHDMERFTAGIPEFYQSKALPTAKAIVGTLSGPNGFNSLFPWRVLEIAEHLTEGNSHPITRG